MKDNYLEYIKQQQAWHDKKSIINKNKYSILIISDIILSATILLVITFYNFCPKNITILISILAFLITVTSTFIAAFPLKSNWIRYRMISERLKMEIWRFESQTEKYIKAENPLNEFMEVCNNVLFNEALSFLYENKNTGRH